MKSIAAYINASEMTDEQLIEAGVGFRNLGIDELVVVDYTEEDSKKEEFLDKARALSRAVDIPIIIGTRVHRFEDVKKAFYTGASAVVVNAEDVEGNSIVKESMDRFGEANIFVKTGCSAKNGSGNVLAVSESASAENLAGLLKEKDVEKAAAVLDGSDVMTLKREIRALGADVNTFESSINFEELKLNSDGMIPCIVQDYKTNEVLMMAYMDEEAFDKTVATGIMTYHSRSRNELWIKGETSGHYQYVRELSADCDKDTLLAKVVQVGAACHTGSRSCFFNNMVKHEFAVKDISAVLSQLYDVVADRKQNPKEGSYTNYLFNKGIDKILKKCGEEATEMVIAAKNPNAEELKYEIADLLYHMTVLMVECGVDWQDVAGELANR